MNEHRGILHLVQDADAQPDAAGIDLRLDLAHAIVRRLDALGWSQNELAQRCGLKPSFISRLIHSDSNCSFSTAARVLSALGVRPRLTIVPDPTPDHQSHPLQEATHAQTSFEETFSEPAGRPAFGPLQTSRPLGAE
ncbi:MAG: helix-turn-helix transcriptional regulator [Phycisphaeraceae bacterium]|nr:helix-turn-helix transcriptional regulator [Phycisphaeraceae bacterium]